MLDVIAFDADDTLWYNERLYQGTQDRFARLLSAYGTAKEVDQALYQTEMRNLEHFGYGIKSFTLSMIETAVELSEGRIPGSEIQQIVGFARDMLQARVELLPHVEDTLARLSASHTLMVITKGDLRDQQAKLARSGIAHYFQHVEVVSEKAAGTYAALLARYGVEPQRFLMVGNSLRSDVLPVLALGGRAVHIPHAVTWAYEASVEHDRRVNGYYELAHVGLLPALVERLEGRGKDGAAV
jgi:putative hydrolase of the HAD superfamily